MARIQERLDRVWPRRGILATEAGRRVVTDVVLLTGLAFAASTVLVGVAVFVGMSTALLGRGEAGHVAVGMTAGLLVVLGAFFILPVFGRLSRLGDDVRLLELCDPGAPLLREMMDRAPGTYSHSIITGTLAEAAAREIAADALLARVGAYYHDVGKLSRPHFFVENQVGLRNPHDDAAPVQSAFIITAHVREGVELARRARLPEPLIDIIEQHHGTSLVMYFYRKASERDSSVDQAAFRYDGPRPRTPEAAVVMLADACEAAARAMPDSGTLAIEDAVRRVVTAKTEDGQLAECGLDDEQIEAVTRVYAKMLAGVRHGRVDYPDATAPL